MTDVTISIPSVVRDHLAARAAAQGVSLRTYLVQLIDSTMTPAERAARDAYVRQTLREWNGYDPTPEEEAELDACLDRQFAEARTHRGEP